MTPDTGSVTGVFGVERERVDLYHPGAVGVVPVSRQSSPFTTLLLGGSHVNYDIYLCEMLVLLLKDESPLVTL